MAKISDELKAVISQLSNKEKDKLLFRLIAKDEKLVRKLIFELLEEGTTLEQRSEETLQLIQKSIPPKDAYGLTPGYLLMDLRTINARITEHVAATKDKLGEVTLTTFMLHESIKRHSEMLNKFPARRSDTLAPYMIKRVQFILAKAAKLHEDYHLEFRRPLNEVLEFIWNFPATQILAREVGLPKEFD
jgi:hypothetical protein